MKRSAGVVLFREKKGKREYLLLQYNEPDYWGLSKGGIEKGEIEEETALREAKEETNLQKVQLIPHFKEKTSYFFIWEGKRMYKEVTWFLGKVLEKNDGKVSWEHTALVWLSYRKALTRLKFKKDRLVVEKAEKFLSRGFRYQQ